MANYCSTIEDFNNIEVAILPVGSLEQHGPHLPVGTDGIIAKAISERLADRFKHSFLMPLLPFSSSYEHSRFGAVSLRVTTIYSLITDILESLSTLRISKLVIVTGHMGNHLLRNVAQELNQNTPRVLLVPSRHHLDSAFQKANLSSTPSLDMHAGEEETSIIMHLYPEAVRIDKIVDIDCPHRPLLEVLGMNAYTKTGAIGFPSKATAEKGEKLLSFLTDEIAILVKEFIEIGQV